jgi:hypothetical protein
MKCPSHLLLVGSWTRPAIHYQLQQLSSSLDNCFLHLPQPTELDLRKNLAWTAIAKSQNLQTKTWKESGCKLNCVWPESNWPNSSALGTPWPVTSNKRKSISGQNRIRQIAKTNVRKRLTD